MTLKPAEKSPLVLLIHDASSDVGAIREMLPEGEGFRLQCVTRLSTALARIGGGGVDAIIVDLSAPGQTRVEKREGLAHLQQAVPHIPLVAICDSETDELRSSAGSRAGASACITKEECSRELKSLVRKLTELGGLAGNGGATADAGGTIIAVLGSKGGVGTTTVALNVAYSLAQSRRVILTEMRPAVGTLAQHVRTHDKVRDLTSLLETDPEAIDTSEIDSCLCPYRNVPGLRVLLGPQRPESYLPIGFNHAKAIAIGLKALADYVVVDLPSMPSEANRAVIQVSQCLALVVERDAVCLESARIMIQTLSSWGRIPQSIGTVIVNRAAVVAPIPLQDFETRLGLPVFAVIPPASDECMAAFRANRPLVAFDSEGLAASSFVDLTKVLSEAEGPRLRRL